MSERTSASPNDRLAEIVADELVAQKLVSDGRKTELLNGLKAGKLKDRDWRLLLEMAADGEGEQDEQAD